MLLSVLQYNFMLCFFGIIDILIKNEFIDLLNNLLLFLFLSDCEKFESVKSITRLLLS